MSYCIRKNSGYWVAIIMTQRQWLSPSF
ncbi:hypothetical protein Bhyg_11702 [Pseudolycoriella hygida]|uniref:Uncharacterized protein n=1 Tax=Pseudolycoriella hygida TaxID=35572 RepID=A0A9Q0MXG8_9DIPT|nr:hypothetical protein Bhyg_11702 [Pseudolycoriella hygida]